VTVRSYNPTFLLSLHYKFATLKGAVIALSAQRQVAGWTIEGRRSDRGKILLIKTDHACCEAHPTSFSMGTEVLSPGVKRPGPEVNHSLSFNAEVRN
jgi:hypothetical protein